MDGMKIQSLHAFTTVIIVKLVHDINIIIEVKELGDGDGRIGVDE